MSNMVEVVIDSIRVHLMAPQRVLILKQVNSARYLTIWVGPYEAEAITIALQEVEVARPLTHDLIKSIFSAFHARITRIEIVKLQDDIFYGSIVAEGADGEIQIDARPSDAIALAVRAHVPILVDVDVMEEAGVSPEPDMPTQPALEAEKEPLEPSKDDGADRLSVFKDFFDTLDLDDTSGDSPDEDKPS